MSGVNGHSIANRLQRELRSLMTSGVAGISAFPDSDIFNWVGTIKGPAETVYEGLMYKLSIVFPSTYPLSPPEIKFVNFCFHPNVDTSGNICLDTLKDNWSPTLDVKALLLSIQSLLGEPNNDSPLNASAASLWDNQEEYKKVLLAKYQNIS